VSEEQGAEPIERTPRVAEKGQRITFYAAGVLRTITAVHKGRRWLFEPADDHDEAALDLHGVRRVGETEPATPGTEA
jgi:hypothetical protein